MTTQQDSVDVERLREAIGAGLRSFCIGQGDFTMSAAMRRSATDHIMGQSGLFAALTLPITQRDEQGAPLSDDERLIRSAIRGLLRPPANARSRRRPLWSAVMATFALGSTKAWELCTKHGFDPDREVRA